MVLASLINFLHNGHLKCSGTGASSLSEFKSTATFFRLAIAFANASSLAVAITNDPSAAIIVPTPLATAPSSTGFKKLLGIPVVLLSRGRLSKA